MQKSFQNDLRKGFKNVGYSNNPNIAWDQWSKIFLNVADLHAPIRQKKVKSVYNPWLTEEIKKRLL